MDFPLRWEYLQRGWLSKVDLLIEVACFERKVNNVSIIKSRLSKLVSKRRSTVPCLSLQQGFPARFLLDEPHISVIRGRGTYSEHKLLYFE